jgi:hypothetical protein
MQEDKSIRYMCMCWWAGLHIPAKASLISASSPPNVSGLTEIVCFLGAIILHIITKVKLRSDFWYSKHVLTEDL